MSRVRIPPSPFLIGFRKVHNLPKFKLYQGSEEFREVRDIQIIPPNFRIVGDKIGGEIIKK